MSATFKLLRDGEVVIPEVEVATAMLARMKGLLGRASLGAGRALYLEPCGSIHTWFMKFTIDVIFLDGAMKIVAIAWRVRPWRMAWGGAAARGALEVESGWLPESALRVGDCVSVR
jgi:uncharacterized protein